VGARVTHASLANNHGLDCGAQDFEFTKQHLQSHGITPFGHPISISENSYATTTISGYRIGLLALHTLFTPLNLSVLTTIMAEAASSTDVQIVYIHWGDEYEETASVEQRRVAETLVRLGADLIIGHHPHVVQEIEQIDNALVVYSLGNFIFDQYFSVPVQQGLVVGLRTSSSTLDLQLLPVTSEGSPARPQPMPASVADTWMRQLALKSDPRLRDQIIQGTLRLPLANLTNSTIIAP
jgi:poly-gamma-glutamate synthesis protein (capsule biosynthesis protein)